MAVVAEAVAANLRQSALETGCPIFDDGFIVVEDGPGNMPNPLLPYLHHKFVILSEGLRPEPAEGLFCEPQSGSPADAFVSWGDQSKDPDES